MGEWLGAEAVALRAGSPGELETPLQDTCPDRAYSGLGKEAMVAAVIQTLSATANCLQQGILRLEWRRQCRGRGAPTPTTNVTQRLPVPFVKIQLGQLTWVLPLGIRTWEDQWKPRRTRRSPRKEQKKAAAPPGWRVTCTGGDMEGGRQRHPGSHLPLAVPGEIR